MLNGDIIEHVGHPECVFQEGKGFQCFLIVTDRMVRFVTIFIGCADVIIHHADKIGILDGSKERECLQVVFNRLSVAALVIVVHADKVFSLRHFQGVPFLYGK